MAQLSHLEKKVEIQSSPEKFYDFLKNNSAKIATIVPQIVKKVELVEGVEGQPGNIKLFVCISAIPGQIADVKVKITVVDDANKTFMGVVVDGQILNFYSHFEAQVTIDKHHVVWTFKCQKANPEVPEPDNYAKIAVEITKALDAYILVN